MELKKDISLKDFLISLDIEKFGPKGAEALAEKVKNVNTLRYHIESETIDKILLDTKGIGESIKENIIKQVLDINTIMLIEKMDNEGFEIFKDDHIYELDELIENKEILKPKEEKTVKVEPLFGISGLTFVMTGTASVPRSELERVINSNGGFTSNSVTKKTDYLIVCGRDGINTTKWRKAKGIGTKMINESDFWNKVRMR